MLTKKKLFLFIFFLFILLGWFLLPIVVKKAATRFGESAVGAKVSIEDVDLFYRPFGFAFKQVKIGNASKPFENIVEFDRLQTQVHFLALFKNEFIVEKAVLEGLSFHTARSSSAALESSESSEEQADSGSSGLDFSLDDIQINSLQDLETLGDRILKDPLFNQLQEILGYIRDYAFSETDKTAEEPDYYVLIKEVQVSGQYNDFLVSGEAHGFSNDYAKSKTTFSYLFNSTYQSSHVVIEGGYKPLTAINSFTLASENLRRDITLFGNNDSISILPGTYNFSLDLQFTPTDILNGRYTLFINTGSTAFKTPEASHSSLAKTALSALRKSSPISVDGTVYGQLRKPAFTFSSSFGSALNTFYKDLYSEQKKKVEKDVDKAVQSLNLDDHKSTLDEVEKKLKELKKVKSFDDLKKIF